MTTPDSGWDAPLGGTREAGRQRLQAFLPRVADYAQLRNFDLPGHSAVSRLSPYLSRRLLTEDEVWQAVRADYSYEAAGKFLQEVAWRTYWKGWLEMRPSVWVDYRERVRQWERASAEDATLAARRRLAEKGRTGLECFDHWVRELNATGYLHNHARMWFASIWIFTLQLPWAGGAEFFYRRLLDADAASNTLSWRWVAGWQTPGKHYLARAENICRFTEGRFDPRGQLREDAPPIPMETPLPAPSAEFLPRLSSPEPSSADGLLIHPEDLQPERFFRKNPAAVPHAVAMLAAPTAGSPCPLSRPGPQFQDEARHDALERWQALFGKTSSVVHLPASDSSPPEAWRETFHAWRQREHVRRIWVPYAPVGEVQDQLQPWWQECRLAGVEVRFLVSPWDALFWPEATKGFFPFREKIPALASRLS